VQGLVSEHAQPAEGELRADDGQSVASPPRRAGSSRIVEAGAESKRPRGGFAGSESMSGNHNAGPPATFRKGSFGTIEGREGRGGQL